MNNTENIFAKNWNALSIANRAAICVLAGSVCISFAPIFVKVVNVAPTAVAFYRLFLGGIVLLLAALYRGERLIPQKAVLLFIFFAALAFSADLFCWHRSILLIGPGLATILANFQVFLLAGVGILWFKEKPTLRLALSLPLALLGLILILEINPAMFMELPNETIKGISLGLATAFFFTIYLLNLRQSQSVESRLPAIANMSLLSLIGAVLLALVMLIEHESFSIPDTHSALMLLLYGIACQGVGWLLLSKGLPHLPASKAGMLILAEPTLSFIWDLVLLSRPTGFWGFAGFASMLLAIYLCMAKNTK